MRKPGHGPFPARERKNKKAHIVHLSEPAWKVIASVLGRAYTSLAPRGESAFNASGKKSAPSTSSAGSRVGDCMICDARLFREWRDWAFPRTSPTRSSTIKRARFRGWRPCTKGTTFWLSVRKRWIVGASTSSTLCKHPKSVLKRLKVSPLQAPSGLRFAMSLYLQQRTLFCTAANAAMGQERTHAPLWPVAARASAATRRTAHGRELLRGPSAHPADLSQGMSIETRSQ